MLWIFHGTTCVIFMEKCSIKWNLLAYRGKMIRWSKIYNGRIHAARTAYMSRHGQADSRCHYDVFTINLVNVPTLMTITCAEAYLKHICTFCVNVIRISILMTVVVKNAWLQNTVLSTIRINQRSTKCPDDSADNLYRTFSNNYIG